MASNGTRTISIRFDGSAKGLIAEAELAAKALSSVGSDTSGLKKAEAEADAMGQKLRKTAQDSKESGSLIGAGLAFGLSAAAPLVGAALVGGVALGFVGVAALVQKNNKQVQDSFGDLKNQVVTEMQGASDQVVPYLVKAGHTLQQEFANLGHLLHTAFSFAGPDIDILTSGVDNLADNAVPGFTNAMRNSKPIVQGISTVFGDLGTTVTTVLNSVAGHSVEFENDLDQIGELVKNVGSITASVLPGLSSGFGTTVGAANGLLSALGPIAPALGQITGEALPAVGAFKLFGIATSPLNKLGAKITDTSASVGRFTTKLEGTEEAGAKAASATTKIGSAVGKLGNSLPFVAAGFALADAGAQKLFGSTDQLANSLSTQTGPSLQATEGQLAKNDATSLALTKSLGGLGSFLANTFVPTTQDVEKGMTDVQKATIAYNEAVARFGPNSRQAATAQQSLATANNSDQQSQQRLASAMLTTNEQLSQQESLLLGSVNANLGYQSAVLNVQQAQQTYAQAVKTSGKNSLEAKQAFIGLQQAQTQVASSAISLADATHANANANDKAKAETNAYAQSILSAAVAAKGHMSPALQQLVNGLSATSVSAFTATGKVNGTHDAIVKINGKTVKIAVDGTGQAVANANAVRTAIGRVSSKVVSITAQGKDATTGVVNEIIKRNNGRTLHVNIDAGGAEISLAHRALGGPVAAGIPYVVGDGGGPEIFVPRQSGRIVGTSESAAILGGRVAATAAGVGDTFDLVIADQVIASIVDGRLRAHDRKLVAKVKAGAGAR